MATYTTNLSLIKPAGTDKIRIAQINQNMDTIDAAIGAVGNTSLQTQVTGISDSMSAVEGGIAIVSNNNTHVAITSGQYVYVKNHATLSEGLYRATQAIATNGTLTLSNVTPESAGGLNSLNEQIGTIIPTETVLSEGHAWLYKIGKLRILKLFTFPSDVALTIPSADRPSVLVQGQGIRGAESKFHTLCVINVGADGVVTSYIATAYNADQTMISATGTIGGLVVWFIP